jgi:eukaryotic-like serine/threonine-protein kinase
MFAQSIGSCPHCGQSVRVSAAETSTPSRDCPHCGSQFEPVAQVREPDGVAQYLGSGATLDLPSPGIAQPEQPDVTELCTLVLPPAQLAPPRLDPSTDAGTASSATLDLAVPAPGTSPGACSSATLELPAANGTEAVHSAESSETDPVLSPPQTLPLPAEPDKGTQTHIDVSNAGEPATCADITAGTVPPVQIGRFLIRQQLGEGAFGVVYLAYDPHLDREVALKVAKATQLATPQRIERFLREAKSAAHLRHPHIVPLFETGRDGPAYYIASAFIHGEALGKVIATKRLDVRVAAQLVRTLAEALAYAHGEGIVHRDIKPANIMLDDKGEPILMDFGLAARQTELSGEEERLTQVGTVMGTPLYMAPEQAAGDLDRIGPASDQYSLGCTLYELLAGQTPFAGPHHVVLLNHMHVEPPSPRKYVPRLPRDLETICLKCLQKDPARRYAGCQELADDLGRYLRGELILARRASLLERGWKWARRHPTAAALLLVFVLGLLGYVWVIQAFNAQLLDAVAVARAEVSRLNEEQHLAKLSRETTDSLAQARVALDIQDWKTAQHYLKQAVHRAGGQELDGPLAELHQDAERLLAEVNRRLAAEDRLKQFRALHEEALYAGTLPTGVEDLAENIEATRAAAGKALKLFAVTQDSKGAPGFPLGLTPAEHQEITEACYEMALVLAEAEAQPLPDQKAPQRRQRAEHGLGWLARAASLQAELPQSYWLRQARYLFQAGEAEASQAASEKANLRKPETVFDFFLLADEEYRRGNFERARAGFVEVLQRRPNHFWAQYYLALCALQRQQPAEARAYLNACLGQRSDQGSRPVLHLLRGQAHAALKDYQAAEEDYRTALEAPRITLLARYGILVNRGFMRFQRGQPDKAVEDFQAACQSLPRNNFQAQLNLARLHEDQKRLGPALDHLEKAIQQQPRRAMLFQVRAQLLRKQEKLPEALKDFDRALTLYAASSANSLDEAGCWVEKAAILNVLERYSEAVTACDRALKLRGDALTAYRIRAEALLGLKRYDEAVKAFDKAMPAGKEHSADLYRARGLARAKLGQYPGAIGDLSQALEKQPRLADLYAERGWVLLVCNAVRPALNDFSQAVEHGGGSDAHSGRGYARVILGEVAEAVADAEAALQDPRPTARLLYNVARIYAQAAARTEPKPSALPRTANLQAEYQDRALGTLQKALDRVPRDQQTAFWRDFVQEDPALKPLRGLPAFTRLEAVHRSTVAR